MQSPRVLIVEDEAVVAMEIEAKLEEMGYSVVGKVTTGEEAVEAALEERPDLIIMDIKLDGEIDGIEAATRIHDFFDVPVLFLTAYADDRTVERAKLAGPFGYLVKPFVDRELRTTIEISLSKYHSEKKDQDVAGWFSTSVSALGGAVIVTDDHGRIRHMNALAEALTGVERRDSIGRQIEEVYRLRDRETRSQIVHLSSSFAQGDFDTEARPHLLVTGEEDELAIEAGVMSIRSQSSGEPIVVHFFRETVPGTDSGEDWFSFAANLRLNASLYSLDGNHRQALACNLRALDIMESRLGSDHPKIAPALEELARTYRKLGRTGEAQMLELRAARVSTVVPEREATRPQRSHRHRS
jgi:CheY-like chemotaxis protein